CGSGGQMEMEAVDALLARVYAQAEAIKNAEDPEETLKEALEPLRDWIVHFLAKNQAVVTDPARIRAQHYWSEAATRIQALVRGNHQRGQLSRERSLHLQGTKVLKKYVLKSDRFPNCHVLDTPDGDLAPNFRRLEGTPLYGSAQPTLEGIRKILDRVSADGFSKVVWVNLREEAVIYVDGMPFTARRSAKLNENDLVPGITGHTVQVLETSMKNSLREQLLLSNSQFEYWHEVSLHENEMQVTEVDPGKVFTLPEIYEMDAVKHANDKIQSVSYYRIPIERNNAPEHADVERLMELIHTAVPIIRTATADTAFVFNCQMGKRRTTTALVLGSLIWHRPRINLDEITSEMVTPESDDYGNFAVIRELVKRLPYGPQAKWWVDDTIDKCAAICNIRAVINEYHELSTAEAKPAKRSNYLHQALSFLERYFYLIVFGAFILTTQKQQQSKGLTNTTEAQQSASALHSFSKWLQGHPNLFRLLDDLGGVKYKSDKVLQKAVVKFDHFPGIARLPFQLTKNVPNFRQIDNEPIFGTAQCLEEGIKDVAMYMKQNFDRVIWINLREEAVIYVGGRPFVIREPDNLLNNVEYPGIEVDEIIAIEYQVKKEIQDRLRKANGLFMYWNEPREFVSEEIIEHINPDEEIKTLGEIYEEVCDDTGYDVKYARIPVSDEVAPEEKDLDDMVRLLVPAFMEEMGLRPTDETDTLNVVDKPSKKTAVVCNCQMGRGRTTTALVCIYMLRLVLEDRAHKMNGNNGKPSTLDDIGSRRDAEPQRQSSSINGEFKVIRTLLGTLTNGQESKLLVDYAVNQCEHLQNLRESIAQTRDLAVDRELSPAKHDFYMLRAVNYLERYFYLICFASYLLEESHRLSRQMLFVTWMNERYGSDLYALLDNLYFEEEIGADSQLSSMPQERIIKLQDALEMQKLKNISQLGRIRTLEEQYQKAKHDLEEERNEKEAILKDRQVNRLMMELQEERVQRLQDLQEIYSKDKQLEALTSEVSIATKSTTQLHEEAVQREAELVGLRASVRCSAKLLQKAERDFLQTHRELESTLLKLLACKKKMTEKEEEVRIWIERYEQVMMDLHAAQLRLTQMARDASSKEAALAVCISHIQSSTSSTHI
ncbi:TPA: hypothetical protein N0F65_011658, partial [Lagenidium giganteum]